MRRALPLFLVLLLAGAVVSFARYHQPQDKPKDQPAPVGDQPIPEEAAKREDPVKPSAEGLARAKKVFSTQCAMCHGAEGDGKGELAGAMSLNLRDWRDAAALAKMTDGELFYVLSKGKGKMLGQEDRFPESMRWNLVNFVRSLSKKDKDASDKAPAGAPKP